MKELHTHLQPTKILQKMHHLSDRHARLAPLIHLQPTKIMQKMQNLKNAKKMQKKSKRCSRGVSTLGIDASETHTLPVKLLGRLEISDNFADKVVSVGLASYLY
jgi:hypothetical protein